MPSMRIKLTDERCDDLKKLTREFHEEHFDEEIGDLRAELLLDFFISHLGPAVYNQAIRDAHSFIIEKLEDLEGEFYETEEVS